jgi:hypothetical protein
MARRKRVAIAGMLGLSVFTGAALASNIGTAHALQIPKTVGTGWWNVNHTGTAGCGGTYQDLDHGGNRAVNALSKFEVLTQVGQKKVHIHINTNAWYDQGAAQASYLYQKFWGRFPTCAEIAGYVGQSEYRVFAGLACNPNVPAAWKTNLAAFCSMPDSVLYNGSNPSAFFQPTNGNVAASTPYAARNCFTPDGARSRERFFWNKLKVKVGTQKVPVLGTFKVFIDAITIDAGPEQQRVLDPQAVSDYTGRMLQVALVTVGKYGQNWNYQVMGRNGTPVFDLKRYAAEDLYTIKGDLSYTISGATKTARNWIFDATDQACAKNPDAKTAYDPTDQATREAIDGAMRNLFDNLAKKPYTTDVLCTAKQPPLCANLFDLTKTVWNSGPDHGKALIKGFMGQLLA